MFGMFRMSDVRGVGCSGCGIFVNWDVWDVGYWVIAAMGDINLQNVVLGLHDKLLKFYKT